MLASQQAIDQVIIAARTGNTAKIALREVTGTSLIGLESTIIAEAAQHGHLNVLKYMEATSSRVANKVEGILDYPLYLAIKNNRIGFSYYIITKMNYRPTKYVMDLINNHAKYGHYGRTMKAQRQKR
jgi:hypothetical protein